MRTATLILSCVLLAACADDDPGDVSQQAPPESSATRGSGVTAAADNTSPMNPVDPPEGDEPASSPSAARPTQDVHLIEYQLHMSETIPAGRVRFNVENGGKEQHAFEIEGNGVHQKSAVLSGGSTAAVDVELAPGTYTVYCPVKDHAQKGMKKTVVVR